MIVNNHRKHSSFAIQNFLAGSCSTYDGAYCLLYAQREQIKMDVAAGDAAVLKQKADVMEFELDLKQLTDDMNACTDSHDKTILEIDYLRKKAEYIRLHAALENFQLNYEGAKRELDELDKVLDQLKPMCKYWNEDVLQMEQDMQNDEWAGELKNRAENMLLSSRLGIPYDHLATMRQHPDFFEKILPHISAVNSRIEEMITKKSLDPLLTLPDSGIAKHVAMLTHSAALTDNSRAIDKDSQ